MTPLHELKFQTFLRKTVVKEVNFFKEVRENCNSTSRMD